MDKLTHKNALYVMYGVLIACLLVGLSYNYGYSKAYKYKSKPIYIKYNNGVNKSLANTLQQAGINATPAQVEELCRVLKVQGKHAR